MSYCVCDEKSPCLYHKEKGMSNHQNDVIAEDREESIHYDLEQTIREARRESGVSLKSFAGILVEVLDADEIKSLVEQIHAASQSAVQKGSSER